MDQADRQLGNSTTAQTDVCGEGDGKIINTLPASGVWEMLVVGNSSILGQQLESDSNGQ